MCEGIHFDHYSGNAVHSGASVSELYGVFVLYRQLNICVKLSRPLKVVNVYTGNEII